MNPGVHSVKFLIQFFEQRGLSGQGFDTGFATNIATPADTGVNVDKSQVPSSSYAGIFLKCSRKEPRIRHCCPYFGRGHL